MSTVNKYCSKCSLHTNVSYPKLMGRGSQTPDILVFNTHPIVDESTTGNQWISRAEKLVEAHINNLGLSGYYSYALKCTPFAFKETKNGPPVKTVKKHTPTESNCCRVFSIELIQKLKPKVVLCLGTPSMQQLMGFTLDPRTARDKSYYHPELDVHIIVTWDTTSLLRSQLPREDKQYEKKFLVDMLDDLKRAQQLITRPRPRKIKSRPIHLSEPFDIRKYFEKLIASEVFSFDIETTGVNPRSDIITDISFSCEIGVGVHILWKDAIDHLDLLREVFLCSAKKVAHNGAFDISFLRAVGIKVNNWYFDTMLAFHIISMSYEGAAAKTLFKLKFMAWFMTTEGGYEAMLPGGIVAAQKSRGKKVEGDAPKKRKKRSDIEPVEAPALNLYDIELDGYADYVFNKKQEKLNATGMEPIPYYSAMDSDVTLRIYYYLKSEIDALYSWVFHQLTMPLNTVLMKMTEHGFLLDVDYMEKVKQENLLKIEEIKKDFFAAVGFEFNIDSTDQLGAFMYKTLKIKPHRDFLTPKGKPSTDIDAINFFSEQHPMLKPILAYRNLQKENKTYLDGFKDLMDENHRIHPGFMQSTTATGRLSSVGPNLQNIPCKNKIRNMFIAPKGHKIVSADLSQAELRILAMQSKDVNMIAAFASGKDFHTMTASSMFNIPMEIFDKDNIKEHGEARTAAKCLSIDTRVPTLNGIITFKDMVPEFPDVDDFVNFQYGIDVINPDGNWTRAHSFYNGGVVEGNKIITQNGMIIEGSDDHKVLVVREDGVFEMEYLSAITVGTKIAFQGNIQDISPLALEQTIYKIMSIINYKDSNNSDKILELLMFAALFGEFTTTSDILKFKCENTRIYLMDTLTDLNLTYMDDGLNIWLKDTELVPELRSYGFTSKDSIHNILWKFTKEMATKLVYTVVSEYGGQSDKLTLAVPFSKDFQLYLFMYFGIISHRQDLTISIATPSIGELLVDMHRASDERPVLNSLMSNKDYMFSAVSSELMYYVDTVKVKFKEQMHVADLYIPDGNKFNGGGTISRNCINFGIVYQMQARTLVENMKKDNNIVITLEQAENFINKFYRAYPNVTEWIKNTKQFARENGYIETVYGRRRYLPDVKSSHRPTVESALRRAVNCVDEETEALTKRGWLKYTEIKEDDILLTKSPTTNILEWQPIQHLSVFPDYEGEVIEFKSKSFSAVTTPHHRWLISKSGRPGNFEVVSESLDLYGHDKIHRTGTYIRNESVYSNDFVELAGWFLTDGYASSDRKNKIGLCQSERAKPNNVVTITNLLSRLKISCKKRSVKLSQCAYWEFSDNNAQLLRKLFPSRKLTMEFIQEITSEQTLILLNTMLKGDGSSELHKEGTTASNIKKRVFYTQHEDVADVFQVLCTMCGFASSYRYRASQDRPYTSSKLSQPILNSKGVYVISILNRDKTQVVKSQKKVYTKKMLMWCPTVANTFFVARRLTNVYITGNTPIQSLASDCACWGLIKLDEYIEQHNLKSHIIGVIHDDILVECPDEEVEEIKEKMVSFMTKDLPQITIPLKSDPSVVQVWKK